MLSQIQVWLSRSSLRQTCTEYRTESSTQCHDQNRIVRKEYEPRAMSRLYSLSCSNGVLHGHRWRIWTASLIQPWSRIPESLSAWFVLGIVWFPRAETNSTTNDISYSTYLVNGLARIYGGDHASLLGRICYVLVVLRENYHSVTWPRWCRYDRMNVSIHLALQSFLLCFLKYRNFASLHDRGREIHVRDI